MEVTVTRVHIRTLMMYCATLRATTSQLHSLIAHNQSFLAGLHDPQRKMIASLGRALRPRARVLREIDRWIYLYESLWQDASALASDTELRAVLVLGGDTERVRRLDTLRETIRKTKEYEAKLGDETVAIRPETNDCNGSDPA